MTASSSPAPPGNAREMLARAKEFLQRQGLKEARLDAELLVAHALGLDRLGLFLALDRPVQSDEIERARDLIVRRGKREPTAFLVGKREFYGRDFRVGPGVLIPRPETELLVDLARDWAAARAADSDADQATRERPLTVLDLGTGSGCLAVTLALELEGARVSAGDVSAPALAIARANAESLGAEVEFVEGNGLAPFGERRFDLVVSNPPYIDRAREGELEPEVREYEPPEALFAPKGDPDHWAKGLLAAAPRLLEPGGLLLVELGFDQAARLAGPEITIHEDLAGVPRVLEYYAP